MNFTKQEMIDMIYVLGASDKNCLLAVRIYHEKYPDRRQPHRSAFERLRQRFDETGNVQYIKTDRVKPVLNEENELAVHLKVIEDPHIGSRKIATETDIGKTTVLRILDKNKFHPYHIQLFQELYDTDYERRLTFCNWAQQQIQREPRFFDYLLFTDEATFNKNGNVNRHNFHYYATENPHYIRTHSQNRWSLNVWGGIIGNIVIGPHFFEERLTADRYLHFLREDLGPLLQRVPIDVHNRMWFMHDGAPVHHTDNIHNFLNMNFQERWIGRGGPVAWPPRSPDLTKMDFFLWGYVKNVVNNISPTTREDMKDRIRNVFNNINFIR